MTAKPPYVDHPSFDEARDNPALEAEIMAPMPDAAEYEASRKAARPPKGAAPEMASLYLWPLLTKPQERHLFRKMNFARKMATVLLADGPPTREDAEKAASYRATALETQQLLTSANARLGATYAKRFSRNADHFFELMSDATLSVAKAVLGFDFSRGNAFSTYAVWSIRKNACNAWKRDLDRVNAHAWDAGQDDALLLVPDRRPSEGEQSCGALENFALVNDLLEYLEARERHVVRLRYKIGLYHEDDGGDDRTLEMIGANIGVTKERVRQILANATAKMRLFATRWREKP